MTSTQIRQSFLDFFKSKQHTLVPSSSLMPDSPNLLFTNAGMNQFVPIFLGQVKCPYAPGRAADTQKCIRAGGKHNDLEDVGLDTYHHTFFEMLGNWSFGDYFKQEAIEWAWELVTGVWKFPKNRLYATVYSPDQAKGDPSEFDQEAYDHWARLFTAAGLDPKVHIVNGGKKDNFWMMGDTGPCGPCSELHVDLTPNADTRGNLVNKGSAQCIEIWNLVFIQFNANPDGTFSPLPARHVDTGMGFERVAGIIQNTNGFTDFNRIISNYETDIFRPIFDKLEQMSGKRYGSTLPAAESQISNLKSQIDVDVAFRVIADHIRTLSFSIADGIQPGNTDRNYVLRRILRRAVRYGRTLGFHEPFFYKLVDVLADTMGDVFPEIRARQKHVQEVIRAEEEAFNKTLDDGIRIFGDALRISQEVVLLIEKLDRRLEAVKHIAGHASSELSEAAVESLYEGARMFLETAESMDRALFERVMTGERWELYLRANDFERRVQELRQKSSEHVALGDVRTEARAFYAAFVSFAAMLQPLAGQFGGRAAFLLYDTYGFPLDLTELMARERGLAVDVDGFNRLMEEQKSRARAAQKKTVIELSQVETQTPTHFVGYEKLETPSKVLEVIQLKDKTAVILDASVCYAEMGGQVGDSGEILLSPVAADVSRLKLPDGADSRPLLRVTNTQKSGNTWLHFVDGEDIPAIGDEVVLRVDQPRRNAIQRHHTVTHLLHWALHEVVSRDASQKGSFVGPDKLTFDFNAAALTPQQIADVEKLVNERILENAPVTWLEVKYNHVKERKDIMQFFGDKYGEWVRVVQVGGTATALDGYSMELCGGTHTRATGEIGLFRITGENAIASGVRRIEAIAGLEAYRKAWDEMLLLRSVAGRVNAPIPALEKSIDNLLAHQKELEKQLKALQQKDAAGAAKSLVAKARTLNGIPAIIENLGAVDGDTLQGMVNELKGLFQGVVLLAGAANGAVALVASVSPEFTSKVQAGKLIQQLAPIVGGKGGGRPDNARGGGKEVSKLDEALVKAASLLG